MHPFDPTPLLTPRLSLRPLAETDAPALYEIYAHPEVMRYWACRPGPIWPRLTA